MFFTRKAGALIFFVAICIAEMMSKTMAEIDALVLFTNDADGCHSWKW